MVLIWVVKPTIVVESCPGSTCHTLCSVPGFSFSSTIGFKLMALAVKLFAENVVVAVVEVLCGATWRLVTCGAAKPVFTLGSVGGVDKSPMPATGWAAAVPPDVEGETLGTLVPVDVVPPCSTVVDKGVAASGGVLEPMG